MDDPTTLGLVGTLVGTAISVVAFFASLYFFRHASSLQEKANRAVTQIAERSGAMQSDIRTVSEKMLDAVISRPEPVVNNLNEVSSDLRTLQKSLNNFEMISEQGKKQLLESFEDQLDLVVAKISDTKRVARQSVNTDELVEGLQISILRLLDSNDELSNREVARSIMNVEGRGVPPSITLATLDRLHYLSAVEYDIRFEHGDFALRFYRITDTGKELLAEAEDEIRFRDKHAAGREASRRKSPR